MPCSDRVRTEPPAPGEDNLYGTRSRVFVDPFPGWNPALSDWSAAANATVNSTTTLELVSYKIEGGEVGYLTEFGQDGPSAGFQEVTWQIMVGGRVYMTFPPIAQVASFSSRMQLFCPLPSGAVVSVVVATGANARSLSAIIKGVVKPRDTFAPEMR